MVLGDVGADDGAPNAVRARARDAVLGDDGAEWDKVSSAWLVLSRLLDAAADPNVSDDALVQVAHAAVARITDDAVALPDWRASAERTALLEAAWLAFYAFVLAQEEEPVRRERARQVITADLLLNAAALGPDAASRQRPVMRRLRLAVPLGLATFGQRAPAQQAAGPAPAGNGARRAPTVTVSELQRTRDALLAVFEKQRRAALAPVADGHAREAVADAAEEVNGPDEPQANQAVAEVATPPPWIVDMRAAAVPARTRQILGLIGADRGAVDVVTTAERLDRAIANAVGALVSGRAGEQTISTGESAVRILGPRVEVDLPSSVSDLKKLFGDTPFRWPSADDAAPQVRPELPNRPPVAPTGVGDLKVVRQRLARYAPGELAHRENVLAREQRERRHRRNRTVENIVVSRDEREEESRRDLQSTERFELQAESERVLNERRQRLRQVLSSQLATVRSRCQRMGGSATPAPRRNLTERRPSMREKWSRRRHLGFSSALPLNGLSERSSKSTNATCTGSITARATSLSPASISG